MTAPMVDYKIHWLKMMSVPESRAVVGRHDGINGRDNLAKSLSVYECKTPSRYFHSSPEIIRLAVKMYVRFPLSLRQVEELLAERGINICHQTVWFCWNRFGPLFAAKIGKRRVHHH